MSAETCKQAREIAEELYGSCLSLNDVATEAQRNDADFCRELDTLVMECEGCNWWFGTDVMEGGELCPDCKADADIPDPEDDE